MTREINILDTTLRDGEQAPGCWFSNEDRLAIALQLEAMGVDVIEAGFPVVSPAIHLSTIEISQQVKSSEVCCLARTNKKDIDTAIAVLKHATQPRIHLFLATSDIHIKKKLNCSRSDVLDQIRTCISYAKKFIPSVQFSCEDGTRSDWEFLAQVCTLAIDAGATVINIADTVGYATPQEIQSLFYYLNNTVPGIDQVQTSVHCHNDLGLATANTLAALDASVDQVECTINGIGERAGNTALEEVIVALLTRPDIYQCTTRIDPKALTPISRLVAQRGGVPVQPNKAVVGSNAFLHESGLHCDGLLKHEATYEVIDRRSLGLTDLSLILGRQSGFQCFAHTVAQMGYELSDVQLSDAYSQFNILVDSKESINANDIAKLIDRIQSS